MSEVLEFTRDDWNMAYAGAEGWPDEHGNKRVPPVQRFINRRWLTDFGPEQAHVIADSKGIEVRFGESDDCWFLPVSLPKQATAIWMLKMLPDDLSPEFCKRLGFIEI